MRHLLVIIWILTTSVVWSQPIVKGEAEDIARARQAMLLGQPELALEQLKGESDAVRVTRLQALCAAESYTDARLLLRVLEKEAHGSFPSPYDFRFYLSRGLVERRGGRAVLARKNFELALRRATNADQKCQAYDHLTALWVERQELEKANKSYWESSKLMNHLESVWVLADHLDVGADLEYEKGELATAAALNRGRRQIYLSNNNPIRAAQSLANSSILSTYSNDFEESYTIHRAALDELLKAGAFYAAADSLGNFRWLYLNLGSQKGSQEFDQIYQTALSKMPTGLAKERARLAYALFLEQVEERHDDAIKLYSSLSKSSHQQMACRAHQGLATVYRQRGQYDSARRELERALKMARPKMMKRDLDWRCDRGVVLLQLAALEKSRHRLTEAFDFIQQGVNANPDPDWAFWRIEARYESLMAAVQTHDLERAQDNFTASLLDMEKLPQTSARASALTNILAALLLNHSVGDDVIEPAELLLGNYNEVAEKLLDGAFQEPSMIARYLTYFSDWQRAAERRKETWLAPQVLIYKGLFLDALGQLDEARLCLDSGLERAKANEVLQAQMIAQLLLARISLRQGRSNHALKQLAEAALASQKLNPHVARFYLLVAGAGQRDWGQPEKALESFTKAIQLAPDEAWSGLYGRALTLEQSGQHEKALEDLDAALAQLQKRGRAVSTARLRAAKARVLAKTGQLDQAEDLFAVCHSELLELGASESLCAVTLDYADCLMKLDKKRPCLDLLSGVLDQLSAWHALDYGQAKPLFEKVVSLALSLKEEQTALRYLQLSRSAELLESVELSSVQTGDATTQKLLQEVSSLKAKLVGLQKQKEKSGSASSKEGVGTLLAQTRQEFFSKLHELRRSEPDFEKLVQLSGSQLSAIQELLSPESALIEYFPAQNTLYLFVVTRHEFTLHQVSISRSELKRLIDRYSAACGRPDSKPAELRKLSRRLRKILIDSTGKRLASMGNIRLVPSGPLWEVSFSSLENEQGAPLVEDYEVSYLSSSDLARIRRTGTRPTSLPKRPLLVSGAKDLRGARTEVQALMARFPDSTVLEGPTVSGESFLSQVRERDLIHIASHSKVGLGAGQSYVELGDDRLTLEEVYGLQLEPSSLIVLSSCSSGAGVDPPGKEVTSLAAAFSVAGASTVIASRWKVDDKSTAQFFGYFYAALLRGVLRGQAFREAELKMAQRHPHPYYWAGFSLLGDPD